MKEEDLRRLLGRVPPGARRLVLALRQMIHRTVPQVEETELWGGLSYHRPEVGGRVKGAVCSINFKRDRVRLEFIHGIRLADPSGLLQGHLVSKRFVPIETAAAAERPEVEALVREAAALDPAEWAEPGGAADSRSTTAFRRSSSRRRRSR